MLGRDGIAGLAALAASLGLLVLSRGLPQPALVPVGPAFYPRIVLTVTALLGAALIVSDLLARRRARPRASAAAAAAPGNAPLVVATFGLFAGYVTLLPLLGFRIASVLFLLGLQGALDPAPRRHWRRIVLVAALTAWLSHFVFEGYLSVLLPRGRWTGV